MNHIIAPSLLAANFKALQQEMDMFNQSDATWLHLDVMDGVFVPNITFGMLMIDAINKMTDKVLDVHLMIVQPEKYIEQFRKAGADVITVHYEACPHLHRTIQQIKDTGALAGVALNPHTPISCLEEIIENVDLVCLMSVNPGFGGQKFISKTLQKIMKLKQLIASTQSNARIEIDGGVGLGNAKTILDAGANVLVAGNSVFGAKDPLEAIQALLSV